MNPTFLGIAAAAMMVGAPAVAETPGKITTGTTTQDAPTPGRTPPEAPAADHAPGTITTGTTTQDAPTPGATHSGSSAVNRSAGSHNGDAAAASGNSNQAVATTHANAPTPAHGANSFTQSQAKSRMESEGFSNVQNLRKDDNGVWRGQANRSGNQVYVWLDYKGNVGTDTGMGGSGDGTGLSRSITR